MLNALKLTNLCCPKQSGLNQRILTVLIATLVLAISAQLSIPLTPVPITFQSATVILIGMALGARLAGATIVTYYLMGCLGAPVFADFSAGIHVFFGPTGGYLMGFLPAAMMSGFLAEHGFAKYKLTSFIASLVGCFIIFLSGVCLLSFFVGFSQAFALGVKPFIFTELIKLTAVAFFAPRFWKK